MQVTGKQQASPSTIKLHKQPLMKVLILAMIRRRRRCCLILPLTKVLLSWPEDFNPGNGLIPLYTIFLLSSRGRPFCLFRDRYIFPKCRVDGLT